MSMRVLVIDNYDSFTYNLVQYLGELGAEPEVVRNDRARGRRSCSSASPNGWSSRRARARRPTRGSRSRRRARSPRPGVPTLGVCLGHQSMVEAFGGRTIRGEPIHGKDAEVEHDGRGVLSGLDSPLRAGRYHSLVADPDLPDELELSATYEGVVMGVRHRDLPAEGVQFHPESVLTPHGKDILRNFLGLMPNEILTRAIDEVCTGTHLTADHASAVLDEIMEGRTSDVETGAFLVAPAGEGGDRGRAGRPGQDHAPAGRPRRDVARRPGRHGGHRRGPVDLQHLHHRRARRGRRRMRGRQARQPLQHEPLRLGGPARGARRADRPGPAEPWPAASTRSGSASCSRPATTPR